MFTVYTTLFRTGQTSCRFAQFFSAPCGALRIAAHVLDCNRKVLSNKKLAREFVYDYLGNEVVPV